jgi:hypothetical protein
MEVKRAHDCREVWRGYTFVENVIPVDVLEERLPLDFLSVPFPRAKPAIWVSSEKLQVINTSAGKSWPTRNGTEPSEE